MSTIVVLDIFALIGSAIALLFGAATLYRMRKLSRSLSDLSKQVDDL